MIGPLLGNQASARSQSLSINWLKDAKASGVFVHPSGTGSGGGGGGGDGGCGTGGGGGGGLGEDGGGGGLGVHALAHPGLF